MAGRLEGKIAIVTGVGSIGPGWGNGKATAVQFAREGATVFGVDITPDAAAATKALIDGERGACAIHDADRRGRRARRRGGGGGYDGGRPARHRP